MVVIEIGSTETRYHISKAFLTHYSEYFRKALNGSWKEAEENKVTLEDIEPAEFNVFVEWLYVQKLPQDEADWQRVADGSEGHWVQYGRAHLLQVKLYVLADRLAVPTLRRLLNRILVGSARFYPFVPRYEDVTHAFNHLPPTDPILDYFVGAFFMQWDSNIHRLRSGDPLSQLPQDFLLRFMLKVGKERVRLGTCKDPAHMLDLCS